MYIIYQFFYIMFVVFYMAIFLFKKRKREGIRLRLGIYPDAIKERLSKGKNIWIHAVSVGEAMTARPLVESLAKDPAKYTIVVSTVTETGNAVAKKIMPKGTIIIYLPMELTCILRRVITLINPTMFIMVETEIWPNLIRVLHKNKVPMLLSNGRISSSSYKWYMLVRPIFKNLLNCISMLLMRTEEDAERVRSIGAPAEKVTVVGNMKFDSVDFAINEEEKENLHKLLDLDKKKLIVAGSTHAGEEDAVLEAYSTLRNEHDDVLLLLAPRHLERTENIINLIRSFDFTPVKISDLSTRYVSRDTKYKSVFILDKMGQLKLFYSLAWVVFVGGSLIKHGGQNMIEPAFFAKPIIFGPHTFNFKDIASSFLKQKCALLVKDSKSLLNALKSLHENEQLAADMGKRAQEAVVANQGAVSRTFSFIKNILQY